MEVILTHEHADFDAVAALVGLARLLPQAHAVLPQEVNANVTAFLTLFGRELPLLDRSELPNEAVSHAWLVDTDTVNLVRGMSAATDRTVIDHHVREPRGDPAAPSVTVAPVGAASTLVTEHLMAAGTVLGPVEATLLYLGIHEDTGSLAFAGTTARDLRAAAWLVEQGAEPDLVTRFLRHPVSESARGLLNRLLAAAETHQLEGQAVVVATGTAQDAHEELSTLANRLMDLLNPDAAVLLVDVGSAVQLVARSAGDGVDVGALAGALGGGGHPRAAAAVLRGSGIEEVRARVLIALPGAVRRGRLVSDIMSWGPVRSLDADQTVGEALRYARQVGHEGYPVLSGDDLVGVVTRRDLDLADHHHLAAAPVARLVARRPAVAEPGDTVASLQALMIAHDQGQVPVLDEGRIVGIVTRTDLLKLWDRHGETERDRLRDVDLDAQLPADGREALSRIAVEAARLGTRAYLVGGIVRDILLGRAHGPDLDVVVEGDAPAVARSLADRWGGSVRVHEAFGTATWQHGPLAIDLITARAERYPVPSALPIVEPGSLRSDLRRRDFSVNALALDLDPDRSGRVIDPFGGLADLGLRQIRILHPLSFVEDPTRILRALRYAVRLGFTIEPASADRLREARALLPRVSAARLLNELRQCLAEPDVPAVLQALDDWGVVAALSPDLRVGERLPELLHRLPETWHELQMTSLGARLAAEPGWEIRLALWLADVAEAGEHAALRLRLTARLLEIIRQAVALSRPDHPLAATPEPASSALYRLLHPIRPEALVLALLLVRSELAARRLRRYASELAGATNLLRGGDLAALGIPPGPVYRQVLGAVFDAMLDGVVADRDGALALARQLLANTGSTA